MMTNHPLAKLHVVKDRVDLDNVGPLSLPISPYLLGRKLSISQGYDLDTDNNASGACAPITTSTF